MRHVSPGAGTWCQAAKQALSVQIEILLSVTMKQV